MSALIKKLFILFIILILNNCGTREFLGFEKPKVKLEGKRVSILKSISNKEEKAISSSQIIINKPVENNDWNQSYNSPTHRSLNFKASTDFSSLKKITSGYSEGNDSKILAQPLIKSNNIYFLDGKSIAYCFNLNKRKFVWKRKVSQADENDHNIGGGLALLNDTVFINTPYGEVIAINAESGELIWKKNVFSPIRSSPTIYNNKILTLTLDNRLIVIDSINGDTLWEHEGVPNNTTIMGAPKVAADDNILVVPYSNGQFFGLNYSNGLVLWTDSFLDLEKAETSNAFTDIDANPVITNNIVILASSLGKVMALDKRTGNRVWVKDINTTKTPLVHENSVFLIDNNKEIVNLDIKNGNFRWITKIDEELAKDFYNIWHAPVLINNKIVIVGGDKKILIMSPETGKIESVKKLPSLPASSPFVVDQKIYLMLRNGDIVTIE